MALRIGINALYLIPGGVGGTEVYLRALVRALGHVDRVNEYVVFVNRETAADPPDGGSRFETVVCGVSARFRPGRILYEQFVLPRVLRSHKIDVLLNPGFTAPLMAGCPQVTVFHDLQHKRHPEFFRAWDLPFWNILLAASAARSQGLIAVSENTARDLALFYPATKGKVAVIPHGVDPEFFAIGRNRGETSPFVLAVSTLHPHKNLDRLIDAFARFRRKYPQFRLVVAGLDGFASAELRRLVADAGLNQAIQLTGWIPRGDLLDLFRTAHAFIAPSLFEGFGMPLAEALAAGIPTACSTIPSFDEVAGDTARRFDPCSIEAIEAALEVIATDEKFRARALAEGPQRAARFDWHRAAAATLQELSRFSK